MQQPYLSIIIPIKNEQENVATLIERIHKGVQPLRREYEIIFVDDGSTDKSVEVLKGLIPSEPNLRVIEFEKNFGQTAALDAGFRTARGAIIGILDGDNQNDPADLPRMIAKMHKGNFDMILGVRTKRNDNIVRRLSSRIANAVRNWVTKDKIRDAGCAIKVFKRACLTNIELYEGMHRFMGTLFRMHGFRVSEMAVRHYPRLRGTAKYGIRNRLWKTIKDLLAVRWMQGRCIKYNVKNYHNVD